MNKRNLFAMGIALALFAASCKKMDAPLPETQEVATQSEWKSISSWNTSREEKYTAYSSTMQDDAITSSIVNNGLVLVYMKDGSQVKSLPFRQQDKETFWYYQVSEKNIQLGADVYGNSEATSGDKSFSYFVISPEKLQSLEEQGHTQASLMTLSFEQATTLLK